MNKLFLFTLSIFLTFSPHAWSDWQGKVTIKMPQGEGPKQLEGRIKGKGELQRLDFSAPIETSTIIDTKSHKLWNLLHAQQGYLEMDLKQSMHDLPKCSTKDVDGCLKREGFKKLGFETLDGHRCTVYEKETLHEGKKMKIKLWRPEDLKEVTAVKSLTSENGKVVVETLITQIKEGAIPDAQFVIPKDYRSLGDVNALLKQFQKRKK